MYFLSFYTSHYSNLLDPMSMHISHHWRHTALSRAFLCFWVNQNALNPNKENTDDLAPDNVPVFDGGTTYFKQPRALMTSLLRQTDVMRGPCSLGNDPIWLRRSFCSFTCLNIFLSHWRNISLKWNGKF